MTRMIDPTAFLASRLYPDMLPFTAQVQINENDPQPTRKA